MAEFQEVMKNYERMCKEHLCTSACPMYKIGVCEKIGRCVTEYGIEKVEQIVMSWAAEHPEPVYPTWIEWLKKFGIISFEPDFHSLLSAYPTRTNSVKAYINEEGGKPIPADIAQKLGIEPK